MRTRGCTGTTRRTHTAHSTTLLPRSFSQPTKLSNSHRNQRLHDGSEPIRSANAELAEHFIAQTLQCEGIEPGEAIVHADRGAEMTAQPVVAHLDKLCVGRSHSRPHVSDDNPYSESQFRTLKYHPEFPDRFGSFEHAHDFAGEFMPWYKTEHRHSGIAMLTPAMVHHGRADDVLAVRHEVMLAAYRNKPERFLSGAPKRVVLPSTVWINPPAHDGVAA